MTVFIEVIRKIVVMVLLMELVLQLQPGKQYEPYLKMFVGILMAYSLMNSVVGIFSNVDSVAKNGILEYQWIGNEIFKGYEEYGNALETEESLQIAEQKDKMQIPKISIDKIKIERIGDKP